MRFYDWFIYENIKDLAHQYRSLMDVPQDPHHHPEGSVLTHVRMVRKAIPKAILELKRLQQDPNFGPYIADIDFDVSSEEMEILALAAWLHDVGKVTATATNQNGKITSIGHEHPNHYGPQIDYLAKYAPKSTIELYKNNKDLIDWLIENHMGNFPNKFVVQNFSKGKVSNTRQMKLLLILMWSDKMGRGANVVPKAMAQNQSVIQKGAARNLERQKGLDKNAANTAFSGGPEDLAGMLSKRNIPRNVKVSALRGKYPHLTDEDITRLIGESMEDQSMGPKSYPAKIPVSQDVLVLSDALRKDDPGTQVYIVGGAVRDFLYHQFHGKPGTNFKPKDEDLTTNLSEKEILDRLRSPYAVQQGIRVKEKESVDTFGVVFASVNGGAAVEIAPFRKDIGSADGRRPDRVERGTIHDDAMRRDLTMNNLYYDFYKGVILDYNPDGQGIEDVRQGVARPVGDPHQRFDEDKLRVLRLVRFFSRFNQGSVMSHLDPATLKAIGHFKQLNQYSGITPERIQMEFLAGIKQSQNTSSYLRNLGELDLYQAVFPGLNVDVQSVDRLGNTKNPRVIMAWMLRGNTNIGQMLNRLKYSNDLSDPVDFLVNAMNFGTDSAIDMVKNRDRRLVRIGKKKTSLTPDDETRNQQVTQEMQNDLRELSQVLGKDVSQDQTPVHRMQHLAQYQPPDINGNELMAQGYKGKAIGDRQRELGTDHYAKSFQDYINSRNSSNKNI